MLRRMILAAAAFALTTPAMATCLEDGDGGAQCDLFLDEYRAAPVPMGTTMVWPDTSFVIDNFDNASIGAEGHNFAHDDVFVWDGETAYVVPDVSGPPIKIADW